MLESWFDGSAEKQAGTIERSNDAQAKVDSATAKLALYYYETCWFCGTVRATMNRLKLNIELRDIHGRDGHHQRLMTEGGSSSVPCLYVEHADAADEWMYESREISKYLEDRFGLDAPD